MIAPLSLSDWQLYDAAHKAPTFFARPAWALALAQTFPGLRAAPLSVQIEDGTQVVVPLMRSNGGRLRFKDYVAFPYGGYTCVLAQDGSIADADSCEAALTQIAQFADRLIVIPWPLGPTQGPPGAARIEHETGVIDLSKGAEDALSGLAGISRRMAGQAARRGVVCERSGDPDRVDLYYELLLEAAKRWGVAQPHIPLQLLRAIVEHGGDDVEIWFSKHEGTIIGGGVVFYGSEELFFWSAAMRHEYGRLRPSNALNVALIRAAAERGMRWYNLGSSEGLPGVARFKRDLGAQDVRYAEYRYERASFALYQQFRRTFARSKSV